MKRHFGFLACLFLFTQFIGLGESEAADKYPECRAIEKKFDISNGLENSSFDTSRLVAPDRVRVVHDEQLEANAIETTWQVGDFVAHGYRNELADQCLAEEGVPIYYSLAFLIPPELSIDEDKSVIIGQFHTPDKDHKPQIALRYRGTGHFDLTFNWKASVGEYLTPDELQGKPIRFLNIRRGHWHKLELVVKWSSETNGMMDIMFNGQHIARYEGSTNYASQQGEAPYFKFGLYPSDGNSRALIVRHAQYDRIAKPSADFLAKRGFKSSPKDLERVFFAVGDEKRELKIEPNICVLRAC